MAAAIQRAERTGRPLGDEAFVRRIAGKLGRNLVPGKPGPKKAKGKAKRKRKGGN